MIQGNSLARLTVVLLAAALTGLGARPAVGDRDDDIRRRRREEYLKRQRDREVRERCSRYIELATRALGRGNLGEAYRALKEADRLSVEAKMTTQLADRMKDLEAAAQKMYVEADSHRIARRYTEAMKGYRELGDALPSHDTGKKAIQRLSELSKDPLIKAEIEASRLLESIAKAIDNSWRVMAKPRGQPDPERPPDKAIVEAMPEARSAWVLGQLRSIVKQYGNCDSGRKAAELLKSITGEDQPASAPATQPTSLPSLPTPKHPPADEAAAAELFQKARKFHEAKQYKAAAGAYAELLIKYPGSRLVPEARKHLEEVSSKL